jgi:hypothetical protein
MRHRPVIDFGWRHRSVLGVRPELTQMVAGGRPARAPSVSASVWSASHVGLTHGVRTARLDARGREQRWFPRHLAAVPSIEFALTSAVVGRADERSLASLKRAPPGCVRGAARVCLLQGPEPPPTPFLRPSLMPIIPVRLLPLGWFSI